MLAAADLKGQAGPKAVIAVGCLAQRYGAELAAEMPEVDAVLGFDDYQQIGDRVLSVLAGEAVDAPTPTDRRTLLPLTPVARATSSSTPSPRRRLDAAPTAPLKIASGCDRRCTFCAIPMFRGSFVSRHPEHILEEAQWLAHHGASELFLVSENTTSYGKDLGDLRALEKLLPQLVVIEGVERVRVSYLQPAEVRPGLLSAMANTAGVAAYFDLSFQHASGTVLRAMRRFGDGDRFLGLIDEVRSLSPDAGIRSNFIVGFPGETDADVEELTQFLSGARLDAVGVFGYSDEDGTEAAGRDDKLSGDEIESRRRHVQDLAEVATAERATARVGEHLRVVVEDLDDGIAIGRADHQGPEVDGVVRLTGQASVGASVGHWLDAVVVESEGVDLVASLAGHASRVPGNAR
jgi:MiaB/RimO family radical SAM methylthiotransferase